VILVCASDATPVPWKNGGGVTRELLRLPAHGDDWTLRISVADIDADGPFSAFPGISRWFAVLTGAGVRLRWPTRAQHVRTGDAPLHFDGDDAPDCTLFDGPTRDLNIMVRNSHAQASVTLAAFGGEQWALRTLGMGFFALRPVCLHGPLEAPVEMPALSLCWQDPPFGPTRPWRIAPASPGGAEQEHTPDAPGYWISLHEPPRSRR
jgi:environmental stress-induced protein Ves